MSKVVCFGSFVVDLTSTADHLPVPAETVIGHRFKIGPGGKGSNQGVAAKRSGADVTMITKIGKDVFGKIALDNFANEGFSLDTILEDDQVETGTALIAVDENSGQNQILVVIGASGNITPQDIERVRPEIENCEYMLIQMETNMDAVQQAVDIAHGSGAKVILNTAPVQAIPEGLLSKVDIVTPNEIEASYITGVKVIDQESARQAAKKFIELGVKAVVITMGKLGSYVFDGKSEEMILPFPVKVVDTTGAGDAFSGGFVTALSEGKDIFDAARFATAVASLSVTKFGTAPAMPYRKEVDSLIALKAGK